MHGTALEWFGKGFLLLGSSASGKSDLALRLLDCGAHLVSDDQVFLTRQNNQLIASCPERLQGKLEVRGVGIIKAPFYAKHVIHLCFKLQNTVERFPQLHFTVIEGVRLPRYQLNPFEVSAPIKLKHLLHPMAQ